MRGDSQEGAAHPLPSTNTPVSSASPNIASLIFVTTSVCVPSPTNGIVMFLGAAESVVALSSSLPSTRSSKWLDPLLGARASATVTFSPTKGTYTEVLAHVKRCVQHRAQACHPLAEGGWSAGQ